MKTALNMKDIFLVIILSALLLFALSFPVKAQDNKQESSKKAKVIVKINNGKEGKSTVIDTIFDLSNPADQKEFQEYMKKFEGNIDELNEKMKNMEVTVNIPDLPDSLLSDSLENHIFRIGKGGKAPRICMKYLPEGFDYKFDMPCMPDLSDFPECCEKYMKFGNLPDIEERMKEFGDKEETLSDIIGDIPMDRVTSYKIKDKKYGKRIIIDVEDAPFMPRGKHGRMIIMGEPGNDRQFYFHDNPKHKMEKKVIIKREKEGEEEEN